MLDKDKQWHNREAKQSHNRKSDEEILMQFAEDQGFDMPYLMDAVKRLKACHAKGLQDYGVPRETKSKD